MTMVFLLMALAVLVSCATTGASPAVSQPTGTVLKPNDNNFTISLGETKTAYLLKQDTGYKLVRVEDGEQEGKDIVIFSYTGDSEMQLLSVMNHLEEQMITYDCYQIEGNRARPTTIMGAIKDMPSTEMWSDGIKTLLIENIRVAK
jgi:hypothetical protein